MAFLSLCLLHVAVRETPGGTRSCRLYACAGHAPPENEATPPATVSLERALQRAAEIADRFEALKNFFVRVLCIAEDEAHQAACRMEHVLPPEVWERLVKFLEYMERCPRGPARWRDERQGFSCGGRGGAKPASLRGV